MLLKRGSKGEDVKKIQKLLGCTADGDFGPTTERLVKEWQKKHALTADGIVGDKTWSMMFGNKPTEAPKPTTAPKVDSKCVDPCVIYKPLSKHVTKKSGRSVKYIAIHYTAGANSNPGRALNTYNTFIKREASADFVVDDRDIVQMNPDIKNYYCWSVGDKKNPYSSGGTLNGKVMNNNSISIEICSTLKSGTSASAANHEGWTYTDAVLKNAIKLTKILMKKFNIPLDRVVRHYDVTGKLCPGIIGWNNENIYDAKTGKSTKVKNNSKKWEWFKSQLQ